MSTLFRLAAIDTSVVTFYLGAFNLVLGHRGAFGYQAVATFMLLAFSM